MTKEKVSTTKIEMDGWSQTKCLDIDSPKQKTTEKRSDGVKIFEHTWKLRWEYYFFLNRSIKYKYKIE